MTSTIKYKLVGQGAQLTVQIACVSGNLCITSCTEAYSPVSLHMPEKSHFLLSSAGGGGGGGGGGVGSFPLTSDRAVGQYLPHACRRIHMHLEHDM